MRKSSQAGYLEKRLFAIRCQKLQAIGCLPCKIEGLTSQPDVHHLTAGSRRRGDLYTIGACPWHHRGLLLDGLKQSDMEQIYGPSYAKSPRKFHERYGSDDDLWNMTQKLIKEL